MDKTSTPKPFVKNPTLKKGKELVEGPSKEVLNRIFAYSKSLEVITTNTDKKIAVVLN